MDYNTSPSSNDPTVPGALGSPSIDPAYAASPAAPWEPRGARASRVLIGVVGAALVGALAIGGVVLSPSKVVHRPATGDQVATAPQSQESTTTQQAQSQTADQMAAQAQNAPTAAGTTPDQASSAAAAASAGQAAVMPAPAQSNESTPPAPATAPAEGY